MVKQIKRIIYTLAPQWLVGIRMKMISEDFDIVKDPLSVFKVVYKVKDLTWEKTYYPEMYGHNKEQCLEVLCPANHLMMTENAIVTADSDVVLTKYGAFWDKYNDDEFVTWAMPADENVLWYNHTKIGIKRYKKHEYISGITLSMVGVWSFHWGHCLISFISKLFCAGEAGFLDKKINLLVVENEDKTIIQIINNYLKTYPNVTIRYAKKNTEYTCENLLFMQATSPNFNCPQFRLDYPYIVPRYVVDNINKYVVAPYIEKIKNAIPQYDKLFLPRGQHRTLINYEEVHEYFKGMGFVDIEGSQLSIEEKATIFYHAKEIVALYGSALQNTMFCNGARCMVLTNYRMATDTSLYIPQREHLSCWINVSGQDESSHYHSNFYIPLEKIKKVYNEYIAQ